MDMDHKNCYAHGMLTEGSKIQDKELGALVYHNLRVLMEETDTDEFEELLQKTIEQFRTTDKMSLKVTLLNSMHAERNSGHHVIEKNLESTPTCMQKVFTG